MLVSLLFVAGLASAQNSVNVNLAAGGSWDDCSNWSLNCPGGYLGQTTLVTHNVVFDDAHNGEYHSEGRIVQIEGAILEIPVGNIFKIGKTGTPIHRQCNYPAEYEVAAPTTSSDRVCAAVRGPCAAEEYESAVPTPTSNRICRTHNKCSQAEFEMAPPSDTADRLCVLGAKKCTHGVADGHTHTEDAKCFITPNPIIRRNEDKNYTTTCSHVHCTSVKKNVNGGAICDDDLDNPLCEKHKVTVVKHHNNEAYGHKHICKHGLHEHNMCGCECFSEDFDFFDFDKFASGHPQLSPAGASILWHKNHGKTNRTIELEQPLEEPNSFVDLSDPSAMGYNPEHKSMRSGAVGQVTHAFLAKDIPPTRGYKLTEIRFSYAYALGICDAKRDAAFTMDIQAVNMRTGKTSTIWESPQFNDYHNQHNTSFECYESFSDVQMVNQRDLRVDTTDGLRIKWNFYNQERNVELKFNQSFMEHVVVHSRYSKCNPVKKMCEVCYPREDNTFDPDCHLSTEYCHANEANLCGECKELPPTESHPNGTSYCTAPYSREFFPRPEGVATHSPTPAPTAIMPSPEGEKGIVLTAIYDGKNGAPKGVEVYVAKEGNYSDWSIGIASNGKTGGGWMQRHVFKEFERVGFHYITSTNYSLWGLGIMENNIYDIDFDENGNDAFAIYHCPDQIEAHCFRYDVYGDPIHPDHYDDYYGFNWVYRDSFSYRKDGSAPSGTWDADNWVIKGENYLLTCDCDQSLELLSVFGKWTPARK
jgi:hypothetical protein